MARAIDADKLLRDLTYDFVGKPFHGNMKTTMANIRAMILAQPIISQPNEWVSVEDELPARDGIYLVYTTRGSVTTAHFYAEKIFRDDYKRKASWQGNRNVTHWMPLPAPPGKDNNVPTKAQNEPLTIEQLREMDGEPVWVEEVEHWALIDIEKSGQWAGIPFAVWAENGANFTYNIEGRKLHCFRRPPEGEEDT